MAEQLLWSNIFGRSGVQAARVPKVLRILSLWDVAQSPDDQPSLSQTRIVSSKRRSWTAAPVGGTMVRCRRSISMSTLLQIGPVN